MKKHLVVRAIDVGYGHIKFTEGRDPATSAIRTDSIPSQSPESKPMLAAGGVMKRRDTFVIPIGERRFEVGRDVDKALDPNQQTEVMDDDFALSDSYAARLYGALNYMVPGLPDGTIDILVLGLPLNTYEKHSAALQKRFRGTLVINEDGDTVKVNHCHVYPQPLGSYMHYMVNGGGNAATEPPVALSIDPGYNTVDWFVCQGMVPASGRNGSVQRGMGQVMRSIADEIIRDAKIDATPAGLIRKLDAALSTGRMPNIYGKPFDISSYMSAGIAVIQEALQAVKNSVGAASDIDVVLLTGGGASMFKAAAAEKFPNHEIVVLENAAHANVSGFHVIGEMLGRSLEQAMNLQTEVTA